MTIFPLMESVGRLSVAKPLRGHAPAAILDAARQELLDHGHARLSTRGVAAAAGVPLSQVHYHFKSKQQLILAVLDAENARRLERQTDMYGEDRPLWQRYEQACDYLEDDLDSGYVRILQEMIASGWSDPEIGARVREMLLGWMTLLAGVARDAEKRFGPLGPFPPTEMAALIGQAFMGGEAMLLLGFDRRDWPIRSALRRIALLIREFEEQGETRDASMPTGQ